jgi:hypothetical protein
VKRTWTIGVALILLGALLGRESESAEVKTKAKAAQSSKTPQAQRGKKPKSLYFPELMIGKTRHPDFMWSPK